MRVANVLLAGVLAGCGAGTVSLSAPAALTLPTDTKAFPAPTPEQVANATYTGVVDGAVTLRDGSWSGPPIAPGAPMHPEVTLARDFMLTGQIGGDAGEDAAVLLAYTTGGSGEELYVAVVDRNGLNVGTAHLGHNVKMREGRIAGGQIVLDVLQPGPNDAMCCPGELATRTFGLTPAGLKETSTKVTGRLAMASINGSEWVLSRFGLRDAAPPKPAVTLRVKDSAFSGSAGCNQYGATVTESGQPGDIAVGPIRATRMACPAEAMAVESRYLATLEKVTKFGFVSGELVLTTSDGGSLFFKPAPGGS